MKTTKFTTKLWSLLVILGLAFTGCSDNESTEVDTQQQDISEMRLAAEVDEASSAMDDIAIDVYEKQEASELGRRDAEFGLPDCVTVTVVFEQNSREVTIDFGTEGCEVNGNTLKGQIILSWERNPEVQQVFISKSLVGFYFNAKSIEGTKTILKELSNTNGNPQFTHTLSITVTWPNGAQASREGTKVREWIEGALNGIFSDNVFEVTGNWTTNFVNGNTHTYEVITPLRREVICYYFVSGTVDVQRTNFGGTFDYGEGDCDNQATFTFNNGTEVPITLN
ncbi:hypothetical protein RM697_11940 [Ichthyenterobacterium sp. W332]|uniref:Lipoprotein n=1 Tax=Microcosmobacter mediterraneus TaxID=3075607 RepID=A0ABU2YNG6_9FLAO|nr:hypothetical protein [Ichthyenterobacterium sp. W332]MDT0559367.1 hypothetical protein [Ichthyenterobacterium sp. W332]